MKYQLAIIIVNYRTPSMTIDCLTSLIKVMPNITYKIIVVDNNSGDDSVEVISQWRKEKKLTSTTSIITSEVNAGFSSGNNIGIKSVNAVFYLLLNSDTLVKHNAIESLIDAAKAESRAGLITPGLEGQYGDNQISCFKSISPISEFIDAAETGIISNLLSKYVVPLPLIDQISNPSWSSFACVLIKKEVFDSIGLLDEGFFMYFEDAEYCLRAKKNGWNTVNIPSARVIHLGGKSSTFNKDTDFKKRLPRFYYEARTRYFYKIYGRLGLILANILWWLGRSISKLRQTLGNTNKSSIDMMWIDIWTNCLNPLKKYTHPNKNNKN